jgi:hypothetical protein
VTDTSQEVDFFDPNVLDNLADDALREAVELWQHAKSDDLTDALRNGAIHTKLDLYRALRQEAFARRRAAERHSSAV